MPIVSMKMMVKMYMVMSTVTTMMMIFSTIKISMEMIRKMMISMMMIISHHLFIYHYYTWMHTSCHHVHHSKKTNIHHPYDWQCINHHSFIILNILYLILYHHDQYKDQIQNISCSWRRRDRWLRRDRWRLQ